MNRGFLSVSARSVYTINQGRAAPICGIGRSAVPALCWEGEGGRFYAAERCVQLRGLRETGQIPRHPAVSSEACLPANVVLIKRGTRKKKKKNPNNKPSISHVIVMFSFFLMFIANSTSPQHRAEIARRVFVKVDSETHLFVPVWSEDKVYSVKQRAKKDKI